MARSTIASVEAAWRAYGFSCDLWTDPPGKLWKDYTHDVDELLMVGDDLLCATLTVRDFTMLARDFLEFEIAGFFRTTRFARDAAATRSRSAAIHVDQDSRSRRSRC